MSKLAIRTEGLGKKYPLGRPRGQTDLGEALADAVRASFSNLVLRRNGSFGIAEDRSSDRYIWALRDVSLEVKFGELVGIMGGQRKRENHAAAGSFSYHEANRGLRRDSRPGGNLA